MLPVFVSRHWRHAIGVLLAPSLMSCAFLLDFDELQKHKGEAVADSGLVDTGGGNTGGTGGAIQGGGTGGDIDSGLDSSAGGSSGGGTSTGGDAAADRSSDAYAGLPLTDLATVLADTACTALARCTGSVLDLVLNGEDCHTLFTNTFEDAYSAAIGASVDAGRITYDPLAAAQCVESLSAAALQNPPQCSAFNSILEDCKSALGGLGGAGAPCTHRFECAYALGCDLSSSCPGTCVALGQSGALCTSDADCDPTQNLYCRTSDTTADGGVGPTCAEYVPVGSACASGDACETGAICVNGSCRRIADAFSTAEGFGCYTTGSLCVVGVSCEFQGLPFLSSATCTAEKNALDPCLIAMPDECPTGYYCSANIFNSGGVCTALPTLNQPCASTFEQSVGLAPQCGAGYACVSGFCKAKKRLGETCEAHNQCYSGVCLGAVDGGLGACVAQMCQ